MSDPILSKAIARGFYPESKGFKESKPEQVLRDAAGSLSRLLWARPWRLKAFVRRVNSLGHPLREKDDSALAGEVAEVRREARSAGLTVESAAMAFALAREFSHRHLGMRHFDVQIMGGLALLKGMVAEMQTGEGKTLTATLPACAAAVAGIPVHIITVNDYLAQRDAVWMAPLYRAMGLSVGSITHDMGLEERRGAYGCDVLYCSNKEIVFDYLKDRLVMKRRPGEIQVRLQRLADSDATFGQIRLRGLPFAIVDEADSVLIDEARTPLIISGQADDGVEARTYREALDLAGRMEEGRDYTVDQIRKHLDLTEEGCFRLEEFAGQLGGVWAGRKRREEVVRQALSAIHLYERDRDYIVRDDRVQIVDEYTGRVMADRSWERGLHQLIEAKEECKITSRSETLARISYQRFFRRYHHMAGMTGTAREVAGELWSVYRLQVITIPDQRYDAYRGHIGVDRVDGEREVIPGIGKGCAAWNVHAEEVLHLCREDQARRAGGKAHDDGMRDEVDQRAHPRETHRQLKQAGQKGQREHELDVFGRSRYRQRADTGKNENRDDVGGSRYQVPGRAEQRRDDGGHDGRIEAILRRHSGQGRECHTLRQHDDRPYDPGKRVRPQRAAIDARPPAQQREYAEHPVRGSAGRRHHVPTGYEIITRLSGTLRLSGNALP